jgi:hypothetical protein
MTVSHQNAFPLACNSAKPLMRASSSLACQPFRTERASFQIPRIRLPRWSRTTRPPRSMPVWSCDDALWSTLHVGSPISLRVSVRHYLIENCPQAILESASAIGRTTGISAGTVVRFAPIWDMKALPMRRKKRVGNGSQAQLPIDRMSVLDAPSRVGGEFLSLLYGGAGQPGVHLRGTNPAGFAPLFHGRSCRRRKFPNVARGP